MYISLFFQTHGYDILIASNGLEALEYLKTSHPGLILLDINMPKMNGLEFMKKFVRLNKHITVVVLSNMSSSDQIEEVLRLGAVDSVTKAQAGPAELLGIVNKYIPARG